MFYDVKYLKFDKIFFILNFVLKILFYQETQQNQKNILALFMKLTTEISGVANARHLIFIFVAVHREVVHLES